MPSLGREAVARAMGGIKNRGRRARALFFSLGRLGEPYPGSGVLVGGLQSQYSSSQCVGDRSPLLGGLTTGNTGANPGRPRRCE